MALTITYTERFKKHYAKLTETERGNLRIIFDSLLKIRPTRR